jgi:DNA polymerase III epsilon subunit-like protein
MMSPTADSIWRTASYAVIDVEGNGAPTPDLVELAVVHVDEGVVGPSMTWLVKPEGKISGRVTRIHGIRNADVADSPAFIGVAPEVRRWLQGRMVVAHQASVDYSVLKRKMPDWGPTAVLDTLRLARARCPGLRSYALAALQAYFAIDVPLREGQVPHRAGYDARLAAALLIRLCQEDLGGPLTLGDLLRFGRIDVGSLPPPPDQRSLF